MIDSKSEALNRPDEHVSFQTLKEKPLVKIELLPREKASYARKSNVRRMSGGDCFTLVLPYLNSIAHGSDEKSCLLRAGTTLANALKTVAKDMVRECRVFHFLYEPQLEDRFLLSFDWNSARALGRRARSGTHVYWMLDEQNVPILEVQRGLESRMYDAVICADREMAQIMNWTYAARFLPATMTTQKLTDAPEVVLLPFPGAERRAQQIQEACQQKHVNCLLLNRDELHLRYWHQLANSVKLVVEVWDQARLERQLAGPTWMGLEALSAGGCLATDVKWMSDAVSVLEEGAEEQIIKLLTRPYERQAFRSKAKHEVDSHSLQLRAQFLLEFFLKTEQTRLS